MMRLRVCGDRAVVSPGRNQKVKLQWKMGIAISIKSRKPISWDSGMYESKHRLVYHT